MVGKVYCAKTQAGHILSQRPVYTPIPKAGERGFGGFIAIPIDRSNAVALVDQINKSNLNLLETSQ